MNATVKYRHFILPSVMNTFELRLALELCVEE